MRRAVKLAALVFLAAAGVAQAQAPAAERGKLLYETHCIACHSTQVHWRDQRLVKTWDGLLVQVARWQGNMVLRWNRDDIYAVAEHLNRLYYHFTPTRGQVASRSSAEAGKGL